MGILSNTTEDFISFLAKHTQIEFKLSPVKVVIEDSEGSFESTYAFYDKGLVRIDEVDGDIIGVAFWDTPGDLLEPQYYIELRGIDAFTVISDIRDAIQARGSLKETYEATIGNKDVQEFMNGIGSYADKTKPSELYATYKIWATSLGKTPIVLDSFLTNMRDILRKNGHAGYEPLGVIDNKKGEKFDISEDEKDTFKKDIVGNEDLKNIKKVRTTLESIVSEEVNSVFIYGIDLDPIRELVMNTLKQKGVWGSKVIWKRDSLHGFTQLYEFLYENREDKIIVIDDCDKLLYKYNKQSREVMRKCLFKHKNRLISLDREVADE